MDVENTYPELKAKIVTALRVRRFFFWTFLAAGAACAIVNLCVGGKAWSVVVCWALRLIWITGVSRPLVENHWMGRTTHCVLSTCVLLILIDVLLSPGWAGFVVPILGFSLLIALGTLFFSNLPRRRQNVLVMFWVAVVAMAAFFCALFGWLSLNWPMIVLGCLAPALMVACIAVLRKQLLVELKKRFHT